MIQKIAGLLAFVAAGWTVLTIVAAIVRADTIGPVLIAALVMLILLAVGLTWVGFRLARWRRPRQAEAGNLDKDS